MNMLKRIVIFIIVIIMVISQANSKQAKTFASNLNLYTNNKNIVNAGVLLYSFDDLYMSQLKQNLEMIQKDKEEVNFTFFNSRYNESIQDEILDSLFNRNFNLLILNLIRPSKDKLADVINKGKQKNIALIIFNLSPAEVSSISESYNKVAFATTDSKQLGSMEGKILIDEWNTNKSAIDKNKDNVLQYIMLQGDRNSSLTIERTNSAISAIENAGIKTKQLESISATWDKQLAEISIGPLLLKYNGSIEAIISNNDAMAIGAVQALLKYGYNQADKSKYISVVGIDGLQEAKDLIDKGMMTGTVSQNLPLVAESLYSVGLKLIYNIDLPENINYKLVDRNIIITLPYYEYTQQSKK